MCISLPELLNGKGGVDWEAFENPNSFHEEIGLLVEQAIGFSNYIEADHLIVYSEEEKIRLPHGAFAFRIN